MKKIIFTGLSLCYLVLAQAQFFCETFNQNQTTGVITNGVPYTVVPNLLDNWGTACADLQYTDVGSQGGTGDVFLQAFDQGCSNGGSWMFNDTDYAGDWTQFGANDNCFCYDFIIINNGNSAPNPPTSLYIFNGTTPFNSTLRARFVLNNAVTVGDGWVTLCAPTDLSDGTNLPSNSVGTWEMVQGSGAADWDALITNVQGVGYYLDIGSSPTEIYGFDNICVSPCPPCGAVVNESIVCVEGGYQYTFEVLNTSGVLVDGIDITIPGVGYDPWASVPDGSTYGPVSVFIPESQASNYCFDILMYSGIEECCHITHCVDLPLCFPCDDIKLYVDDVDGDPDECCYEISVSNNFHPMYFTSIVTTVLTPGVNFDNPVASAGWSVSTGTNVLTWSPPGPFIDQVSYLDPINFCFNNIAQTSQMPQVVVFDWMTLDMNGQDSIACSDTLTFHCEPCLMIENKEIKCLDDGTFEYCFAVTNNGPDPASQLYLDPYGPMGTTFTPNPVPVSLAPGATGIYCVNISGVSSGDIVEYKALLKSYLNDTLNWCCIVDTFRVEIPECDDCICDDTFAERVAQGYNVFYGINSCKGGFVPIGLEDCYEVTWTANGVPIGTTMGNAPFYYTIPPVYTKICMVVTIPGTDCYYKFCRKLKCKPPYQDDNDNPSFKIIDEEDEINAGITIRNLYPNPVNDLLNISLAPNLAAERLNIQIVNAMGEIVLVKNNQNSSDNEIQVDVSRLSEGIYFLRVEGKNQQSDYLKFVKLK